MPSLKVFGIKQCDTVRKALRWLEIQGFEHQFHDLRVDGFDRSMLESWLQTTDFSQLINRRSTSWRKLSDADKQNTDAEHLIALLLKYPTLVKRPVFVAGDIVLAIGFSKQIEDLLEQWR